MGLPDHFDVTQLADELADRYRFERELGRGGSASVWLAHDLRHDRLVALKVLRPELCVAIGRERFLHEIRLTARLQHPHILPLLDSGEAAGRLWYTMPFVEGESLRQRLARRRQLPVADALAITRQVAGALTYAHAHGVLHRDIKPDNILLSEGGAQVADFGIARLVDATADDRLTSTGLALGTPLYMSPEQLLGSGDVDHRTDQYALACTTYEMLTGEPPFTGATAHALMARRLTAPVPSVRLARPDVPEAVAASLDRALEREPGNRHATVAEFARTLDGQGTAPATPPASPGLGRRRRFMWPAVAGALLLAALAVWATRRPSARAATLDVNLVAVLPFDVLDPSLSQWHEGMADVLARYLDGAGPLRTVPAATVLRQSPERSNRASADVLGRSLGANVVVFGDLAPLSRDSVRLRATVLSLQEGRGDDIEVRGLSDRMGQLADSLGRATLLALGRYRPINAVVGTTMGDAPLPALKAFLHGERLYRGGHYDSALVQYNHALQLDSSFSLAHMRMVLALWYGRDTTGAYQSLEYYASRALGSLARLSPRDSLLIVATACLTGVEADTTRPLGVYGQYQCARDAARQAVARYPTDPESWFLLGEVSHHGGPAVGEPDTARSFERAVALDSFFMPAFDHVIEQAASAGHLDRAARYASLAAVRTRGTPLATRFALDEAALAPVGASQARLDSLIRVATPRDLWDIQFDFRHATDSLEVAVRVGRALHERHVVPPGGVQRPGVLEDDSLRIRLLYAGMLATRGHLREAARLVRDDGPGGMLNPYLALALLGAIPAARADSVMRRLPHPPETARPWSQWLTWSRTAEWWRARRDTAELQRVIQRLGATAHGVGDAMSRDESQARSTVARAYLSLARGDTASALRQLAAIPDSLCIVMLDCATPGLVQASILAARGRDAEAARLFDRWIPGVEGPLRIGATLERGRLAERMGDRATARDAYQHVLDAWRHADPELEPYTAEARAGVARLIREPLDSM